MTRSVRRLCEAMRRPGGFIPRPSSQSCGAKRIRTAGLVIANDALYQLSYSPEAQIYEEARTSMRRSGFYSSILMQLQSVVT